jgi:hypothetical protein
MQLDRYLRLLSKHRQSPALAWVGFLLLSLVVWKLVSDGDFSFIMTYGAFARTFGFGLLAVKLWTARSATGVSFKTLQLYALVGRRKKQEGEREERGRAESRREGGRVLVGKFLGLYLCGRDVGLSKLSFFSTLFILYIYIYIYIPNPAS